MLAMSKIFNRKTQKRLRKHFRNNATEAETKLWSALKGKQLQGFKFRRQQGVGKYVVDFYCPMVKLAIEVDGATHWTQRERIHDAEKEEFAEKLGIIVVRFTNTDVYENLDGVLEDIHKIVSERLSKSRGTSIERVIRKGGLQS
jgi:very-short-patch-repair endonuclease